MIRIKYGGFWLGIILFLVIILAFNHHNTNAKVFYALGIAILMAVWWITEALPLAITSLVPIILFPLFGIMNGKEVSSSYFNDIIFLFIGGFMVAIAMQKWNLHKRIALKILSLTGNSPRRILFGFMLGSAFLSMWISNTASTMMMIPILISVINEMNSEGKQSRKFQTGLLLGVAYGASIGGIATLIGSPPNMIMAKIYSTFFPELPSIGFTDWLLFAGPVSIILFLICFFYLFYLFKPKDDTQKFFQQISLKTQFKALNKITFEEKIVLGVFISMGLLWIFRSDISIGQFKIPGWSSLLNYPEFINDGTIAVFSALLLFAIPSKTNKGTYIMDWKSTRDLPWNIVLLFGGGFALAAGIKQSGLDLWLKDELSFFAGLSPFLIILFVCLLMTFLTEVTSNTATTGMILPVLAALSASVQIHPLYLMLPATLSASMAFMLPVATPPNAIIFGTNKIRIKEMARTGFFLNLIGAIVISLASYFLAPVVLKF